MPIEARGLEVLIEILAAAGEAGALQRFDLNEFSPGLKQALAKATTAYPRAAPVIVYPAVTTWAKAHGLVSLEIGNPYPPYLQELG